jgi:imidazolonepropionase-like amidohydrolase
VKHFTRPYVLSKKFADSLAQEGESAIHTLALEASWAAKYAELSHHAAIKLISSNIEEILGVKRQKNRDIVIWEGNPFNFGASVAIAIDGDDGEISSCWPVSD